MMFSYCSVFLLKDFDVKDTYIGLGEGWRGLHYWKVRDDDGGDKDFQKSSPHVPRAKVQVTHPFIYNRVWVGIIPINSHIGV